MHTTITWGSALTATTLPDGRVRFTFICPHGGTWIVVQPDLVAAAPRHVAFEHLHAFGCGCPRQYFEPERRRARARTRERERRAARKSSARARNGGGA